MAGSKILYSYNRYYFLFVGRTSLGRSLWMHGSMVAALASAPKSQRNAGADGVVATCSAIHWATFAQAVEIASQPRMFST